MPNGRCPFCPSISIDRSLSASRLLQLDFLEHSAVTDVIVCTTVLEEVRGEE